ncbi:MAG: hypothetical protein P8H03_06565 [Emcibacteraceae bacterium]|nr:hypothetical protein [Emcibacteraceae bacterium]
MRKKTIGGQVLDLLVEGKILEATDLFNQECAALTVCPYSQNHNKCIDLCLMPKLNFMEIRDNEVTIKLIIEKLKTHSTIYK